MKKLLTILSLVFVALGTLALYLVPIFWQPEPVFVFRVGLGAGVFAVLFFIAVFVQILLFTHAWSEERASDRVRRADEETHRQFLRRLDHEIKNPLTGLQAALTNLREAQTPDDTTQAMDNAHQAANRLGRILRDLRKLAELDAQMLERRPLDVGELVSEMVRAACTLPAYRGRKVNLLVSQVPTLPPVIGDWDLLGLAFYNLLDNALKFTHAPDAVEVRVREDGPSLFVEVADGGAGIPFQEQALIFEDLYRGENARETEGSGLGLPLARRIILLHGGELLLRSNPPHAPGTVFIIRLPAEKEKGRARELAKSETE